MDETHRAKECATLGQWSDNAGGRVENRIWYHFLEGRVFLYVWFSFYVHVVNVDVNVVVHADIDLMFDFGDNGDVSVALDVDFNIEVWSSFWNQGLARSLKLKQD